MGDVLFGVVAIGLGALLLFSGYRLARILLPLWGFFAGFSIGAAGAADAFNSAFLGTSMGIVIGLIIGLIFAVFAYFFYSLAVVLLGASVGYWLGTGFMSLLGFDKGFLSAVVGISLGIVVAALTLGLNVAKYLLIAITALGGASAIITGILLVFNQIDMTAFDYVTAGEVIKNSWFWTLGAAVLFILGFSTQALTNPDYTLEEWTTAYGAPKGSSTYKKDE